MIYRAYLPLLALLTVTAVVSPQSVSDGPHLFHRAGGRVEAIWVADGQKKSRTFKAGEPIRLPAFRALLGDAFRLRTHRPPPAISPAPGKLLVLTDVEGRYADLRAFLLANKVIDRAGRWCFGKGHLVTIGDMVDRGDHVTEVLWLMYRLAGEAEQAGGRVHYILGNHESMIMGGDTRYVAKKYEGVCSILGMPYESLVGADTELGRWLRAQNTVERIGRTVFVHAGISPELPVTSKTIDDVNRTIRAGLGLPKRGSKAPDKHAVALIWGPRGPHWYRGYFPRFATQQPELFGPRPTDAQIDALLAGLDARMIVVGHSKVASPRFVYDGRRVLALDVPWTKPKKVRGLAIRGDRMHLVDWRGEIHELPKSPRARPPAVTRPPRQEANGTTLPRKLMLREDGPQRYRFVCEYAQLGRDDKVVGRHRIQATYARALPGGKVRWSGVAIAKAKGSDGKFGPDEPQAYMNDFAYPLKQTGYSFFPQFFRGFPNNADATYAKNLVWDTHMFERFGRDYFGKLELNVPHRPAGGTGAVPLAGMGSFENTDIRLTWIGESRRNKERCALIQYEAFLNRFDIKVGPMQFRGGSHYWGIIWVSLVDKQIEHATLNELVTVRTTRGEKTTRARVLRRGRLEKVVATEASQTPERGTKKPRAGR